jgi:hypothetical protein
MVEEPIARFAYIAFDEVSKAILAHGQTALDALCVADSAAPDSPIHILDAGNLGAIIWNERMDLVTAKRNLLVGLPSMESSSQKLPGRFVS